MKLSEIIKHIRETSDLSQEELALKIGVGRLAVTRWENDRTIPNKLAQRKIYDIVKENKIQLFSYLTQDSPEHEAEERKIVLYHGSRAGIDGNIRPISRDRCDFGRGFYMGTQIHQPLTLICSFEKAAVYTVELDLTGLKVLRVPTGIEWAMLVAYSRGKLENIAGTALYERYKRMLGEYDVIVGKIADDRMFYVLDRFFMGDITDKGLVESLSALQLGEQYVALTEKACGQVKILERREISELERLCVRDISEQNRKYGIETANNICRSYRREGRFFDEMLKGGD
jgi:transcriptional regulator with XRE-family HTH domain